MSRRVLLIDIDVPYERFKPYVELYKGYVSWLASKLGLSIERVVVKESGGGNTHAMIVLGDGVSLTEEEALYLEVAFGGSITRMLLLMDKLRGWGRGLSYLFDDKVRVRLWGRSPPV